MFLPQNNANRTPTYSTYTSIEERTSLTARELEDLYQRAWEHGYKSAREDMDRKHNEDIEGSNKVPNIF